MTAAPENQAGGQRGLWRVEIAAASETVQAFEEAAGPFLDSISWFIDGTEPKWRIEGFAEKKPDPDSMSTALAAAADALGVSPPAVSFSRVPEKDWLLENLKLFPPQRIGRFFVYGTHYDCAAPSGALGICLNPGPAFGSGDHPTTKGCLLAIDRLARGWARIGEGRWAELLAEPPFVPPPHPDGNIGQSYRFRKWNYWMMSQRSGSVSYLTFSAGLSLALYLLFYVACDIYPLQLGVLRTFGTNALAGYVLHGMVASAVQPFMPQDVPGWYMWSGCAVFLLITYLFVRSLEKNDIYIKL